MILGDINHSIIYNVNLQGCLISEKKCDKNSCKNTDEKTKTLNIDAFHETIKSDSNNQPDLERNISTKLGLEHYNNNEWSLHELQVLGLLKIDICYYSNIKENCNNSSSHLMKTNCIINQGETLLHHLKNL